MLSTHMQRSQVDELSAQFRTLRLPHLTPRSGHVAVYLGSCLCTVLTGAPQAAVATAKAECRLGCR